MSKLKFPIGGAEWHPYPQEEPPAPTWWYLVTIETYNSVLKKKVRTVTVMPYNFGLGFTDVIAWAYLPEPYTEENNE